MKTTVEIPDDLVSEIEERAQDEGKNLDEEVADLLRKGLDSAPTNAAISADLANLEKRRAIAAKFISGDWGLDLSGFEANRAADREAARARAKRWSE